MAKLYFRYGAMGSSKTANAIMVQYNYHERGQRALMLKPRLDTRDGDRIVGSRSGLSAPCRFIEEIEELDVSQYDCLIVDEAQFLKKEQVERLVRIVDDDNIPVICYGLRADFRGELFEGSMWLMAWADTIEEIKTVCWCGKKATFNARVSDGRVVKAGEQIMIGGNESYVALCRRHWADGVLAPVEVRSISAGRDGFLPLLLDADPSEDMIRKYLDTGDMYALMVEGRAVAVAVVLLRGDELEIMNIATEDAYRHRGYGSRILRHVMNLYQTRAKRYVVGTDSATVPFYEKNGFRFDHTEPDYFTEHYDPPILVGGAVLRDRQVLTKEI
ncbi:MAG: thymidine kinase [Clostridia bacterium]|nr:thymidine kinase [Clostridia bacterium]